MARSKKKAEEIEVKKAKEIKPKSAPKKPTVKKVLYPLIQDVKIGDDIVKKGTKYPLTEKGAKYFKSKFYIK